MTSKDRRSGGVFVQQQSNDPRQPWVRVVTSPAWRTGSRAHHQLVKSGHAFIRAADSLFVWGVHAASPVQNLRQTLPGWGHSTVIGMFRSYQSLCGLMLTDVAIILDAGDTSWRRE